MRDEILSAMASDMNIRKFVSETDLQYTQRVLYSALSCWIKASALDRNISETNSNSGASKKHIFEKSSQILNAMLGRVPEARRWFYPNDETDHPVRIVRYRLMQNGDLTNIGFGSSMTIACKSSNQVNSNIVQLNGLFFEDDVFYSGISSIKLANFEEYNYSPIAPEDWLNDYCNNAWWEEGAVQNDSLEFFNCYRKSRNIHSCWQNMPSDFIENIRLVRIVINENMYEYYLEKQKHNEIFHHKIDPFVVGIHEHRKIMFVLRKKARNPVVFQISEYDDHIKLNVWVHLPYEPKKYLESFAWPSRNISDVLEWILPICLKEDITFLLTNCGMVPQEGQNG